MVSYRSNEGVVIATEKTSELPGFSKPSGVKSFTTTRIKSFTCPACKEILEEVISVNGKVQGWCGRTHTYVHTVL